ALGSWQDDGWQGRGAERDWNKKVAARPTTPLTAAAENPSKREAPAGWRRGYAADCKSVKTGSIPVPASTIPVAACSPSQPRHADRAQPLGKGGRGTADIRRRRGAAF